MSDIHILRDLKDKQVRFQLVILIEKRTHVKGRKNVLLRKIKDVSMESVYFLGTVCTSRTDEGKTDMDNFHIRHETSDYSTEVRSRVVFLSRSSPLSPPQVKPGTSLNLYIFRQLKHDPVSSFS